MYAVATSEDDNGTLDRILYFVFRVSDTFVYTLYTKERRMKTDTISKQRRDASRFE